MEPMPPADWDTYLAEVENQIAIQGTTYEYPYGGTIVQSTPVEEQSSYANSVDKALYLTNQGISGSSFCWLSLLCRDRKPDFRNSVCLGSFFL